MSEQTYKAAGWRAQGRPAESRELADSQAVDS